LKIAPLRRKHAVVAIVRNKPWSSSFTVGY
jgi:hypothetical protein